MKKLVVAACALLMAGAAYAGMEVVVPETEDADGTGAIVLLALLGVVIASGMYSGGGAAKTEMDTSETEIDETSGL